MRLAPSFAAIAMLFAAMLFLSGVSDKDALKHPAGANEHTPALGRRRAKVDGGHTSTKKPPKALHSKNPKYYDDDYYYDDYYYDDYVYDDDLNGDDWYQDDWSTNDDGGGGGCGGVCTDTPGWYDSTGDGCDW
jgi:hypothetical protein